MILFVNFYEFSSYFVDVFSIESLSRSRRKIRTKNSTLTLKNLWRNDLISHRDSSVNQLESRISKSNKNLLLLKENLQKNVNRRHIDTQVCFCLEHLAHAISFTRRQNIETRQHLTQFESSSSFSSMNSSSFFSSITNRVINDSSNFVSTTFRRREVFEVREKAKEVMTLRDDIEARVTKKMKSCVEIETKTEESSIIRRCLWFFIFRRKFRRRSFSLARNSSKFENSFNVVDFFAMMTTNSIIKIEVRIKDEFATISATKTFDDSENEKINIVNKRIKTFRFISSNIEFWVDSSKDAKTRENVTKKIDTRVTENVDTTVIKDVDVNAIKDAKIINDFESTTKWKKVDVVSTSSKSRRNEREFTNVLFLIIFLKRSNSRLIISSLEEAEDFVSRERRELVMLTMK